MRTVIYVTVVLVAEGKNCQDIKVPFLFCGNIVLVSKNSKNDFP